MKLIKRAAICAVAFVTAAGTIALGAGSANAADPDETFPGGFLLSANYPVTGTAHLKKANVDVPLGPTTLAADVGFVGTEDNPSNDLAFNATLPLPPKTVKFKAFGYLPVQAKVYFTQVGPATGVIGVDLENDQTPLNANARYVVTLRDIVVGGAKANVGDNCQTRYPIDVNISSPNFDIFSGGPLTGGFDLGKFNNCKSSTDLVNLIVPSNENTVKLKLGAIDIPVSAAKAKLRKATA